MQSVEQAIQVIPWSEKKLTGSVTLYELNTSHQPLTEVFTEAVDSDGGMMIIKNLSELTIISTKEATYHCIGVMQTDRYEYISQACYYPVNVTILTDDCGNCWLV